MLTIDRVGLPPLVLAPALVWLPESPRWLISRQRLDQAQKTLEELHKTPDDPDNLLATSEFVQIREQLQLEKAENRTIMAGLKQPSMRKRLVIAILTPYVPSVIFKVMI